MTMPGTARTRTIALIALAAVIIAGITVFVFRASSETTPHAVAPARGALTDQILYFALTDRFANGDPSNDDGGLGPDPAISGFDPTDSSYFQGGDLAGIEQRLDYIADLGATGIWITPPFTNKPVQPEDSSAGYHGYWITDFTEVDPHLGGTEALESLVDAAHERGLKVFLDIITNHTADVIAYEEGDRMPYIATDEVPYLDAQGNPFDDRAAAAAGDFPEVSDASFPYQPVTRPGEENAKTPAWLNDVSVYHNRGNTSFLGEDSLYGDFYGLDDLWTEHPQVVEGMIEIYSDWTATGIDGYRIDTVRHVDDGFWEAFVPAVLQAADDNGTEDFFIFGEVFDSSRAVTSRFTVDVGMPAVLDFPFQDAARSFASGQGNAAQLADFFTADDWYTSADTSAAQLPTFLGNHDMGRFGWMLLEDNPGADDAELLARSELAHGLLMLSRGNPVVYYGDEQGLTGDGGDKAARQPLFGTTIAEYTDDALIGTSATLAAPAYDTAHPLYAWISELAEVVDGSAAFATGAHQTRLAEDGTGVYAFSRMDREERLETLVAVNSADQARTVTVPTWSSGGFHLVLGDAEPTVSTDSAGAVTVTVPAFGTVVYTADAPAAAREQASVSLEAGWDAVTGGETDPGRLPVVAEVSGDEYAEVSFWRHITGGEWEHLGTDDSAPYQVYDVVSDLAPGDTVTYQAVVSDGLDLNADSEQVTATVPEPTISLSYPAPGDTLAEAPLVVAEIAPARVGTSVLFERRLPGGEWETVGTDTTSSAYAMLDDLSGVAVGTDVLYRASVTQGDVTVETSVVSAKSGGAQGAGTPSVPGSYNDLVGCAEVWQPDCEAIVMEFDEAASEWTLTVELPAGAHEYKIAIDGAWTENYGEGGASDGPNMVLELDADSAVTFRYDPTSHVTQAHVD